jgi:DNA-binding transcriptional MerR regulator
MGYYDPTYLKPHHKQAVRLRLQGYSHEEIGKRLKMHPKHVSKVLNSKKALQHMEEIEQKLDRGLKENFRKSFQAKINGLKGNDGKLDLDTASRLLESALDVSWTKRHSRRKRRTAEDVVAEMIFLHNRYRSKF